MTTSVDFPVTHRRGSPKLPYRFVMKLVRRLNGPAFVSAFNRASRFLGLGLSMTQLAQSGLYQVTDRFGSHVFAHPRRVWTIWGGLAHRGRELGAQYFANLIDFKDGDFVVDVGANTGDMVLFFKGQKARVNLISFEPAPQEFAALSHNLANADHLESHQAHQKALWHETTEGMTFYLKSEKGDSSLLPIKDQTETVTVPTARLDEVLADRPYRCLKLEAEGAEPEILQGATGILHRFDYIMVDVGFERGVRSDSTLPQVINLLTARGFEVIGFNGFRFTVLLKRKDVVA